MNRRYWAVGHREDDVTALIARQTREPKSNTRKKRKAVTRRLNQIRGQALYGMANPNSTNVLGLGHKMQRGLNRSLGRNSREPKEERYQIKNDERKQ